MKVFLAGWNGSTLRDAVSTCMYSYLSPHVYIFIFISRLFPSLERVRNILCGHAHRSIPALSWHWDHSGENATSVAGREQCPSISSTLFWWHTSTCFVCQEVEGVARDGLAERTGTADLDKARLQQLYDWAAVSASIEFCNASNQFPPSRSAQS